MKKISFAAIALVGVMVAPLAEANHSWNNFHWARSANPFTVSLVDSVVGVWDGILPSVASEWSASSVLNTSTQGGTTSLLGRLVCSMNVGKAHVCNANYGPNGWFGLATVRASGSHITAATVQVNDFYFTGSFGNNVARHHVLCQEVGHVLGLDHVNTDSCMNDNNNQLNSPSSQDPNQHDYDQLVTIYSHLDGGAKIGGSAGRSAPTSVRRVGDELEITYIFWA